MALVKYNNNSISDVTAFASVPSGAMTLIKTLTASSSATLSFVNGSSDVVLDGTYPVYKFVFINIHPASANTELTFNMSTDTGSNYNVAKTSHFFRSSHQEDDGAASLDNATSPDLGNATGVQHISGMTMGGDNDQSLSGEVRLFNPSGTTFVKFYNATTQVYSANSDTSAQCFVGGYGNTTSAINAIQFTMSSGNIQSGTFKLYGIL